MLLLLSAPPFFSLRLDARLPRAWPRPALRARKTKKTKKQKNKKNKKRKNEKTKKTKKTKNEKNEKTEKKGARARLNGRQNKRSFGQQAHGWV